MAEQQGIVVRKVLEALICKSRTASAIGCVAGGETQGPKSRGQCR
jgi:hypothetical protein